MAVDTGTDTAKFDKLVKENIGKDEAAAIKKKLEDAGATTELK